MASTLKATGFVSTPTAVAVTQRPLQEQHALIRASGLALLVLGVGHFALIPGTVLGGQRVGWNGTLWLLYVGPLNPLITWPLASLLIASTILCYVRGALRPLGVPVGPRHGMRQAVTGAVTSLIAFAVLWPGLQPSPLVFAALPLASAAVLAAWGARRFYGRGPLAVVTRGEERTLPRTQRSWLRRSSSRIGRSLCIIGAVLALALGTWFFVPTSTPPIVTAQGQPIPGSIATMEQLQLGGVTQRIVIRGTSVHNPVLLFLAGGPGGSELGWVRHYNADLEQHFVVVNWEQRGAGTSFPLLLTDSGRMTPQQYVAEGLQLTTYLRQRFGQDRIYLVGHSWGTFLGIWMVQQHPTWFHAYVGVGQMVSGAENDRLWYAITLQRARQAGDTAAVRSLLADGAPSYRSYQGNPLTAALKVADISFINDKYMAQDIQASGGIPDNGNISLAVNTPEYRPIDKLYWLLGLSFTFVKVYPQLYGVDFVRQARRLETPIYFVEGRWDINAPTALVERYYRALQAPSKQLVWFERSGHNSLYQEAAHFNAFMVTTVLRQTSPVKHVQ